MTPSPGSPSSGSSVSGGDSDTEKPLSAFYQSLLESSYAADGKRSEIAAIGCGSDDFLCPPGFKQLSEKEMMQKALMHSIQEITKTRRSRNNTDDEYDSP